VSFHFVPCIPLFWVLWFFYHWQGFIIFFLCSLKVAGASSCNHDYEQNLVVESLEGLFFAENPLTHSLSSP
jgi:hypothetical protein